MEEIKATSSVVLILLDADVYIHFHKGDRLSVLQELYSGRLRVLDTVSSELFKGKKTDVGSSLENMIKFGVIKELPFPKDIQVIAEYAKLSNTKGKGESACLSICRFYNHILASSNTSDIKTYCDTHSLAYLTTLDILCIAHLKGILTHAECDAFITKVKTSGSYLKCTDFASCLTSFESLKQYY